MKILLTFLIATSAFAGLHEDVVLMQTALADGHKYYREEKGSQYAVLDHDNLIMIGEHHANLHGFYEGQEYYDYARYFVAAVESDKEDGK
jgi:hypothetical protein